ncbi:MAG TPA: amidohydrolase family protein [Burkholderiaceae bacterium]|jgi:imidazolonepropionase-like amidohydrolase
MHAARLTPYLLALVAIASSAQPLSPEVRKFVVHDEALIAVTHVRVIDGTGAAPLEDRTLVLRGGKIEAVTTGAPPAGATVLDGTGRSVIPGLVGMHNHLFYTAAINPDENGKLQAPGLLVTEVAFAAPRMYLGSGVTSMRTTGSIEPYTDLNVREQINSGKMPGPKLDVTGPYLQGPGSVFAQMRGLTTPEEARKTVDFWVSEGVTSFKAYMDIKADVLGAAIAEAHKHGLKVTGHLCSVSYREAIALGIDNLEHGPLYTDSEFVEQRNGRCPGYGAIEKSWAGLPMDGPKVQGLIDDLIKHKVAITSTLPVFEASIATRPLLSPKQQQMLTSDALRNHLKLRAQAGGSPERARAAEALLKQEMAFERAFVAAGGLMMAGPDPTGNGGTLPGFADQRGVELLVEAGFTPVQAIQIATANGARYLGQFDRIGSIAAGKQADLVLLKGDPSQRIQDIENVELVFKDGVAYDPVKLINEARGWLGLQ